MAFFDANGARLFYTDDGDGPPMVLVHGFSCDSHDWSWQIPHFSSSRRLIVVDLRGHGRSSAPDDGYGVASLASDVIALLDHVACGPTVAMGHSLGGAIVTSIAVERPDLVAAVVAVDPGHLLPDELGPALAAALSSYLESDPGAVAGRAFDELSHTAATPPALATWHKRRAAGVPVHVLRQTMAGLIGGEAPFILCSNCEPYYAGLEQPVLSFYIDPQRAAIAPDVFAHPRSRTVCFEGSGHWLHQERPREFNSIVDAWLAELASDAGR
jgi:pimeloyl-ACP methyl ester carboxylesterase